MERAQQVGERRKGETGVSVKAAVAITDLSNEGMRKREEKKLSEDRRSGDEKRENERDRKEFETSVRVIIRCERRLNIRLAAE